MSKSKKFTPPWTIVWRIISAYWRQVVATEQPVVFSLDVYHQKVTFSRKLPKIRPEVLNTMTRIHGVTVLYGAKDIQLITEQPHPEARKHVMTFCTAIGWALRDYNESTNRVDDRIRAPRVAPA